MIVLTLFYLLDGSLHSKRDGEYLLMADCVKVMRETLITGGVVMVHCGPVKSHGKRV